MTGEIVSGARVPPRPSADVRNLVRSPARVVRSEREPCPEPCPDATPDKTTTLGVVDVRNSWQPFAHSPRYPIVTCSGCGDRLVDESNVLRRLGWTESTTTRPRYFRCAECVQAAP